MPITERATQETIEAVHHAYMVAALWSSTDDDGDPLDRRFTVDDIAPESRESMLTDVTNFLAACWGDTWPEFTIDLSGIEPEQIGHDYWLTRNHHGAGFWDRGLGDVGDQLTKLAHADGDPHLYVGDDGQVWVS